MADVQSEDPRFGQRLVDKVTKKSVADQKRFTVSITQASSGNSMVASRPQMSSVICTWYKPSRVAWLQYGGSAEVNEAVQILNSGHKLGGLRLQAIIQTRQYKPFPFSV